MHNIITSVIKKIDIKVLTYIHIYKKNQIYIFYLGKIKIKYVNEHEREKGSFYIVSNLCINLSWIISYN